MGSYLIAHTPTLVCDNWSPFPVIGYRRERLSPRPTAFQGDCQAAGGSGCRASAVERAWGGTARIAREPSSERIHAGGCES